MFNPTRPYVKTNSTSKPNFAYLIIVFFLHLKFYGINKIFISPQIKSKILASSA